MVSCAPSPPLNAPAMLTDDLSLGPASNGDLNGAKKVDRMGSRPPLPSATRPGVRGNAKREATCVETFLRAPAVAVGAGGGEHHPEARGWHPHLPRAFPKCSDHPLMSSLESGAKANARQGHGVNAPTSDIINSNL